MAFILQYYKGKTFIYHEHQWVLQIYTVCQDNIFPCLCLENFDLVTSEGHLLLRSKRVLSFHVYQAVFSTSKWTRVTYFLRGNCLQSCLKQWVLKILIGQHNIVYRSACVKQSFSREPVKLPLPFRPV